MPVWCIRNSFLLRNKYSKRYSNVELPKKWLKQLPIIFQGKKCSFVTDHLLLMWLSPIRLKVPELQYSVCQFSFTMAW